MLDTSNYSKNCDKSDQIPRRVCNQGLTSVQEQNDFVWLQHGLSSKQAPGSHSRLMGTTPSLWTAHPSSLECQGSDRPHLSLTAGEGMNQLPSLPLGTQELRAVPCTAAGRRNQTHPWKPREMNLHSKPNLCCVIRETDTASQRETDPAPDELGE